MKTPTSNKELTKSGAWITDRIETPAGAVPRVATCLAGRDLRAAIALRWNIGRLRSLIPPGLYAVGRPGPETPILVSANYKLSFDELRSSLAGCDAWLLVLDTKGINVWCAAGKGTFCTQEIIDRLASVAADKLAPKAPLILPQLGAPGVAAYEVSRSTGRRVIYGPVRARDLPIFLRAGLRATPEMRRVQFTLRDRLAVVPVELVQGFAPALCIMLALFLAAGITRAGYRWSTEQWPFIALAVWVNFLAGIVLTPILLFRLPGRAFAVKGGLTGLAAGTALWLAGGYGWAAGMAILLMSAGACSYMGLMFTGSTPYTSAAGVRREVRLALPLQIAATGTGLFLWFSALWRGWL